MKTVMWKEYGAPDVLKLKDIEKPIPKNDEVLIKIHSTTVTMGDCETRNLKFSFGFKIAMRMLIGFKRPKRIVVLGQELSGEIEAVGKNAVNFKVGDHVFGSTGFKMGAYSEYICMPDKAKASIIVIKPPKITFNTAAAITAGGMEAVHFINKAEIKQGESLLIVGGGGSIGTFALQYAKTFGAVVTVVDNEKKLEMLTKLGADYVIDYKKQDFWLLGNKYEYILDMIGKDNYLKCIRTLKSKGKYLLANPTISKMIFGGFTRLFTGKKLIIGTSDNEQQDLEFVKSLVVDGIVKVIIDKKFKLDEIVKAHKYVESVQKQGNVIIEVYTES